MKLIDMVIVPKDNQYLFDSVIDNKKYEVNSEGFNTLLQVLHNENETDEQKYILTTFDSFLQEGKFEKPRVKLNKFVSLEMELLQICNLKCKHCYLTDDKSKDKIDLLTFKSLLKQGKESDAYVVELTGGELFLDKTLFEKLSYARQLDYKITLTSNAMLISEDKAKQLKDLKVSSVTVTLNGTKEQHEKVYGKNSYNKAVQGLDNLYKFNVPININYMKHPDNLSTVKRFEQEMRDKYNILDFTASDIANRGQAKKNTFLQIPIIDESKRIDRDLTAKCGQDYDKGLTCSAGITSMFIKSNGNVLPCGQLTSVAGNIHNQSLEEILQVMEGKRQ